MEPKEVFSIIGGHVDEELLKRNQYLAAENEILRSKIKGRLRFTDAERIRLAKLGKELGRKALADLGPVVTPDTILAWYRDLIAKKFDGSQNRGKRVGRPRIDQEIESLVLMMAEENPTWGYDRIAGALSNIGYELSDQTVGNILQQYGLGPVRNRKGGMSWSEFIESHKDVLAACDFFTVEVLTPHGMITYYVLFFIRIGDRRIHIGGITPNPNEQWMKQIARNVTMDEIGFLCGCRYLLMDRDSKFAASFRNIIDRGGVEPIRLPCRSPDLNSFAERWILSVKSECLSWLIFPGEESLRYALNNYLDHFHQERNHQGLGNVIPFPRSGEDNLTGRIACKKRLGGLLKFYYREAA